MHELQKFVDGKWDIWWMNDRYCGAQVCVWIALERKTFWDSDK